MTPKQQMMMDYLNGKITNVEIIEAWDRERERNKRYREALEFYRNGLNYTWKDGKSPVTSSVMIDGGLRACQALESESE